jgi:thiol-disulfide isomerase/thioredoxin
MALPVSRLKIALVSLGLLATVSFTPAQAASAVDLPFKDLNGRKVHLKNLRGKPVVLNFWATWCVPCRSEMPIFVEMEKQYSPRGIVFVAVSLDDRQTRPRISDFVETFKIGFAVWTGASSMDLADLKLGQALPATAFLDPEGHVVARVIGEVTKQELQERLEWLSGGQQGNSPNPRIVHLGAN